MKTRWIPFVAAALWALSPVLASASERTARVEKAQRLVTLGGVATELAFALGAGDAVVGVDDSSVWPEQAQKLPKVGYYRQFSVEGLLSLSPTTVLANEEAGPPDALEQLRRAGVDVHLLPPALTPEEARSRIRDAAEFLGRKTVGDRLISILDDALHRVPAQNDPKPRALFFMSHGRGGLQAAGEKTQAEAMLTLAGAENAVRGFAGYRALGAESAIAAAPDVVVTTTATLKAAGGAEGLARHPILGKLEAVKSGRVVTMDDLYLLGFGPRLGDAALELSRQLRPIEKP